MFKVFGLTISATTWLSQCFSMSKVRTTRPTCHHGNRHRAGYCKASQPLHKDARWSHQFWFSFSLALSFPYAPKFDSFQIWKSRVFMGKGQVLPLWSLVHMLCHQHLVLAPQRDFFALNLQIRQIFTRSSFDHGIMASPPPPQDALHSVQPLQFPQTQSRTCKTHSAKNQWICASVQKCLKYPNLQTSKNVSTDLPSARSCRYILIQKILHLLRFDHACLELGSTSGACLYNEVSKKTSGIFVQIQDIHMIM